MKNLFFFIFIIIFSSFSIAGEAELAAELQLVGIKDDLDIFILTEKESQEVRVKLAESMLKKVMLVRSVSPKIKQIKGEALKSICLLSNNLDVFDYVKNKPLVKIAKGYIQQIETEVKEQINVYQKTMKGEGCYLSPKLPKTKATGNTAITPLVK
ncbi:MAG: hypothetical protein OXE99_12755 [Cellvibrionales bacterium]|nr:hypothetical protein [Cellvibrionales bacterium]